jgi:hypothetical protein
LGGIENVDSIILIYDLDRDETFFRLENHWLPLIERCYNGGVSILYVTTVGLCLLPERIIGANCIGVCVRVCVISYF